MKKRDLKNKITEAFESEMPDLRSKILASCEKEAQLPATAPAAQVIETPVRRPNYNMIFKRVAACAICLMLFIFGLSVVYTKRRWWYGNARKCRDLRLS